MLLVLAGLGDDDALGETTGDGDGLAEGVVAMAVGLPGASSSTWRNRSTADFSSGATSSALLCGTETTMSLLPCCWTLAPVKP